LDLFRAVDKALIRADSGWFPEAVVVVDVIGAGMTTNAIHYGTILVVEVLMILREERGEREEREEEELEVLL
jgi:hypothetical protein